MHIEDLDTPALLVDLDGLEDNLDRYQRYFDEHGIGLRPHIKTHKCVAIAHMQMRRGAIGITCQKLGEAEVMAEGGVDRDILIPYNIIGAQKLARLVALARDTRLTIAADSEYTVQGTGRGRCTEADVTVGVVVELDRGRTGVGSPEAAVALGEKIDQAPNIELRGIMSMPATPDIRPLIQETLAHFDRQGLPHPIVSGGSTSGAFMAHEIPRTDRVPGRRVPSRRRRPSPPGNPQRRSVRWPGADDRGQPTDRESRHPRRGQQVAQRNSPPSRRMARPSWAISSSTPKPSSPGPQKNMDMSIYRPATDKPQIGEQVQVLPVHPCPLFQRTRPDLCRARRSRGSSLAG